MGIDILLNKVFQTNDSAVFRHHKDDENLQQVICQLFSAYFADDHADELTNDPIFTAILNKDSLASQPTLSRFFNRLDEGTLSQFEQITKELRRRVVSPREAENDIVGLGFHAA